MATYQRTNNIDENTETDKVGKLTQIKKIGAETKRAALGELGNNRTVLRGKDVQQKESLKEAKCLANLKNAKARVDTHWKKAPVGAKKITRSNSLKTSALTKPPLAPTQSGIKPTTVTVKAGNIEHIVSTVKVITKSNADKKPEQAQSVVTLRREDSNLSRKSLTKLKAALSRDKKETAPSSDPSSKNTIKTEINVISVQSHSSKLLNEVVENIDSDDTVNPILVSEYVNDIYCYLYHLEIEFPIVENHLKNQTEVTPKMRAVLIDWINEVHYQFHLVPETFQMAVGIIDRYLQAVKSTSRQHLQLVGVTALFIASKYEELFPPAIGDFVYITDDTYNKAQILHMERKIIKTLKFNLARPLPIHFLRRYSKAARAADYHHTLSKYFLELTAAEYSLAHYRPSEIAAASLYLSLRLFKKCPKTPDEKLWTTTLEYYSRYTVKHLEDLVKQIAQIVRNAPKAKLKAVYQKYQSSKFDKISLKPELYGSAIDKIIDED